MICRLPIVIFLTLVPLHNRVLCTISSTSHDWQPSILLFCVTLYRNTPCPCFEWPTPPRLPFWFYFECLSWASLILTMCLYNFNYLFSICCINMFIPSLWCFLYYPSTLHYLFRYFTSPTVIYFLFCSVLSNFLIYIYLMLMAIQILTVLLETLLKKTPKQLWKHWAYYNAKECTQDPDSHQH